MIRNLTSVAVLALLPACAGAPDPAPTRADETTLTPRPAVAEDLRLSSPDVWGDWGVDLTTRDLSVHPGDDFNRHVSGVWMDSFEIPADRSRYGAFDLLQEKSEQRVRRIIEDLAAAAPDPATPEGKVAAFYSAFMDTAAIETADLAAVAPYFAHIDAISDRTDLAEVFASPGFKSPLNGFVWVDDKDPDTYIFQMSLGGLGLPDRDDYLKTDEKALLIRAKYLALLTTMLAEAGYAEPAETAASVMALETEIARDRWDRTLSRNPEITYNKISRGDLQALAGAFPVAAFLKTLGLDGQESFLASEIPPTAEELAAAGLSEVDASKLGDGFAGVFKLASTVPLETWKAYLKAHFLIDHASVLPARIDDAVFDFYGRTLRGQPVQRERWKRGVSATEGILGEAIGKVFVERHFPPENKAAMDALVLNLRRAMKANLDSLTWMSAATKSRAEEKLASFNPKIGYPSEFETFETLKVGASALENAVAAAAWQTADNLSRLGAPVDRSEWFMTPQTVNAYYNPSFNEIVFPAAILQPPFFNLSADPAVNYGAIGGVIGHEIGHGFDDQGAKFDAKGALNDWWTEEDKAAFRALGDGLVAQYNAFCPLDEGKTCVNGRLALGENIGDLGGLSMAYRAYRMSLDTDGNGSVDPGEEAPVLDGLTGDQRFFMAWAQVWRSEYRDEALRRQLVQGPHSPPEFRTNGIVRNFDEWYAAFGVGPEHALYLPPDQRIRIW